MDTRAWEVAWCSSCHIRRWQEWKLTAWVELRALPGTVGCPSQPGWRLRQGREGCRAHGTAPGQPGRACAGCHTVIGGIGMKSGD